MAGSPWLGLNLCVGGAGRVGAAPSGSERLRWCCCHLLETEDSRLLPEGARDRLWRGLGDWGQAPDRLLTGSGPSLRLPLLVLQVLLPGV